MTEVTPSSLTSVLRGSEVRRQILGIRTLHQAAGLERRFISLRGCLARLLPFNCPQTFKVMVPIVETGSRRIRLDQLL